MSQTIRLPIKGVTLCPEDLQRASVAFEGAWTAIAEACGRDVNDQTALERQQLAHIVMEMVQQGPASAADIATACIARMRPLAI